MPEVRVIGHDGAQLGVLQTREAIHAAESAGYDLVEISPKAVPPVCRIMDYGKFKYEKSKQAKEARKNQSTVILKEIKFRPKTDDHDFDFKVKHITRFLQEGNKVKLAVVFRGREIVHPETGHDVLKRVIEATQAIAQVEQSAQMEGRRMQMVLAPRGGVIRSAAQSAAQKPVATPAPTNTLHERPMPVVQMKAPSKEAAVKEPPAKRPSTG